MASNIESVGADIARDILGKIEAAKASNANSDDAPWLATATAWVVGYLCGAVAGGVILLLLVAIRAYILSDVYAMIVRETFGLQPLAFHMFVAAFFAVGVADLSVRGARPSKEKTLRQVAKEMVVHNLGAWLMVWIAAAGAAWLWFPRP